MRIGHARVGTGPRRIGADQFRARSNGRFTKAVKSTALVTKASPGRFVSAPTRRRRQAPSMRLAVQVTNAALIGGGVLLAYLAFSKLKQRKEGK